MSKKDTLRQLGMRKEFNSWVKQIQKIPLTFEDVRVGHTFEIYASSAFIGWKGVVTEKHNSFILSTLTSPSGEVRKAMQTGKNVFEGHLRFI